MWYYKGEPVAQNSKAWVQHLVHGASSFQISPNTSHYMEAVFSIVRKINGRQPGDPMKDLSVHWAIWGMLMNTIFRAAVHLGKDYDMNFRSVKNDLWKTTRQLFRETEKVISGQTETTGTSLINFQDLRWMSTSLLHSRAYQYSTAKAHVFSDSVLCLGKIVDNAVESRKKQVQLCSNNKYFSELNRMDGETCIFSDSVLCLGRISPEPIKA